MRYRAGSTTGAIIFTAVAFISQNAFAQQGGVFIDQANAAGFADKARQNAQEAAELEFAAAKALEVARKDETRIAAIKEEIRKLEVEVAASRASLSQLENEEARASELLRVERSRHGAAFSAMIALSKAQGPMLLAYHGDPARSARGASVIAGLREALKRSAGKLQLRISELGALREKTEHARERTRSAIEGLRKSDRELWGLIGKRREESRANLARAEELKEEAASLSRQSHRLTSLIARSPKTTPPPRPALRVPSIVTVPDTPVEEARGKFLWPVVNGRVAQRYGDTTTQREALGLVIDAPAFSDVTAPWDGTVSYAGPVEGLDLVTVIDIDTRYQIILAGLASVERQIGDAVFKGELIGRLGGPISSSEEFLAERSALEGATFSSLYLQVRKDGKPIDPGSWLEPSELKVIRKADAE